MDESINLIGEDRNTTIIDGGEDGNVLHITADWVNLSNFGFNNSGLRKAGIKISSDYNTISSCCLLSNYYGVWIYYSDSNNIKDCTDTDSANIGIRCYHANDNNISNCESISSTGGSISLVNSNNNIILECTITNGGSIYLCESSGNTISRCNVTGSRYRAISLYWSDNNTVINCSASASAEGIKLYESSFCNISGCNLYDNARGLYLEQSSNYNTIYDCIISDNWMEGGLVIEASSNYNVIYHNNFIDNTNQAYDECSNTWDDGYPSGGNYWDDYTGSDNYHGSDQDEPGSDGIGDTPYWISGGSNQDNYPLVYPYGPPYAEFEYIVENKTVDFNASSSGDYDGFIVSYGWDFGDGTNGTGMIVAHTYSDYGIYNVTLTVTDDDDMINTKIKNVYVGVNQPPVANFTFEPSSPTTSDIVYFNSTSYDPDGNVVNWTWDMGDGTMFYGENVTHQYSNNGSYTVNLTVTDNGGATDSTEKTVAVGNPGNQPPVADADGPYNGTVGEDILFNASGSYDPDGGIIGYRWDWTNDGVWDTSWLNTPTTTHCYSAAGNYTARLQVKDDENGTANDTCSVEISEMRIEGYCPINLAVTDPMGRSIDKTQSNIPSATYSEKDLDGDGDLDDQICIKQVLNGNYTILVEPEPNANTTDTFSLFVIYYGKSYCLAEDTNLSDIPDEPYIFDTTDEEPPEIYFVKPVERSLYIFNKCLLPFPITLIIGDIDVEAYALDNKTVVNHVEFYLDNSLKANITTEPYTWSWSEKTFGKHMIKAVAYDNAGNQATDEITVWKFF